MIAVMSAMATARISTSKIAFPVRNRFLLLHSYRLVVPAKIFSKSLGLGRLSNARRPTYAG